jgi:hypothetical protein
MECNAKQQSTKRWSGISQGIERNNGNNHPNEGIERQQRHPTATKNKERHMQRMAWPWSMAGGN